MTIGDNIKAIRTERKLTQEKLAKEMGISRSYLSDIENSRKNPSSKTLKTLSEKLGVSMLYLTSGQKTVRDLNDNDLKEQFESLSDEVKTVNASVRKFVEKNLKKLGESELEYIESQYLANSIIFLRNSKREDVRFLASMIAHLNINKNAWTDDNLEQEELLDFIDGEVEDYKDFLKHYYGYNKEGE